MADLRDGPTELDAIAALDSDWSQFDPREQAALAFARKLTLDPELVEDDDIAVRDFEKASGFTDALPALVHVGHRL